MRTPRGTRRPRPSPGTRSDPREGPARQTVVAGGAVQPQGVEAPAPDVAHTCVGLEDHERPAQPGQVMPRGEARLARADDDRLDALGVVVHLHLRLSVVGRVAQLGAQRAQERLRALDRRVARRAVDHVQRPAVARGGRLGHPQPHLTVLASPDERRRHGDPRELLLRDRVQAQRRHERARRGRPTGRARLLEGVGLERPQALAHLLAEGVAIGQAGAHEGPLGALGRPSEEAREREGEPRRGPQPVEAVRAHQHQPARCGRVARGIARRERPAEEMADEDGRRRAGARDQLVEPCQHALAVQPAVGPS